MAGTPLSCVFISCPSGEFENPGAPFPGLRSQLRHYLARAGCGVEVQEDFCQAGDVDTVQKLDRHVRKCAAVIHLIGESPGALANKKAVADYLAAEPDFLAKHPELRAALGDCSDLSYTQWEAFLALHHEIPLFVYATDKAATQAEHQSRLVKARKHPARIKDDTDLFGQLIGDIRSIIASVPKFDRKIAPSRILRHSPQILFGRESWLDALDAAWANPALHVYTLVAWGGVGKTSLVARWVSERLAARGWADVERYFDWSFYTQGTGESGETSSDSFIEAALKFFDDPDPLKGGPWERGERLAGLVRQHRTLLVLDGIEPLQYPVNDPQAGRLKDQALEALLQGLAADNSGLCVVTTREHLKNIESQATVEEQKLDKLVKEAAIALLRHLQVVGTEEEMAAAWKDAGGHALTLQLLGRFLVDAHGGDIRRYREVKFEEADVERQGRSAFKVMIAYEKWLKGAGPERQRELDILRLTGLFDRPMAHGCLQALRVEPPIAGLTDSLTKLKDAQWNVAVKRLGEIDLLAATPDGLDAHPLIREYFAKQLRETLLTAYREAHSRLFDHLCENTPHRPDTLEGLQPLYQAVVHGCLAGRQQDACDGVYLDRILRGTGFDGFYSSHKLGAFGADLAVLAAFFDRPWAQPSTNLADADQAWVLNEAAYDLRALGRLTEALEPFQSALHRYEAEKTWKHCATAAGNLSELKVLLGQLPSAVADAQKGVAFADRCASLPACVDAWFRQLSNRCKAASALYEAGETAKAHELFSAAESILHECEPDSGVLYSIAGFYYREFLLASAERRAWLVLLGQHEPDPRSVLTELADVERRAHAALSISRANRWLLDIALDRFTLGRVGLLRAILTNPLPQPALNLPDFAAATNGLRDASQMDFLPKALLASALFHFVRGDAEAARMVLVQAQEIAERGPMPLYLADIRLHRARLFRDRAELAEAATIIRDLGYGRRYDELADAEVAAEAWPKGS